MENYNLKMKGLWNFVLKDKDGNIKQEVEKHNIIVNGGFDFIANAIGGSNQPTEMSHMAIGSGNAAPAATNTALSTQISRLAANYAHTTGTKTFTFSATWNPGSGTGSINEAGIFNSSTSGTMLNRVTFSTINKGASDTLNATFTFTMS